jgi:hypothetical protein
MEKYGLFFSHLIITRWLDVLLNFIRFSTGYYCNDRLSSSRHRLLKLTAMRRFDAMLAERWAGDYQSSRKKKLLYL